MGVRYSKTYTRTGTDRYGQHVTYRTTRSRRGLWGATMGPYRPRTRPRWGYPLACFYIACLAALPWALTESMARAPRDAISLTVDAGILLAIALRRLRRGVRRQDT